MTILSAELEVYRSAEMSDAATNGGRMSKDVIPSAVPQNVFPHVFKSERTIGSTKYRKIHHKVSNDDDDILYAPGYCFDGPTLGDDRACFWPGTHRDFQADAEVYAGRIYGAGTLNTALLVGGSTIIIDVKHLDQVGIIQDGDLIRITDKVDPSASGNEELHTVSGAPTVVDTQLTIPIAGTLAYAYAAWDPVTKTGGKISSVYEPGDLQCLVDNWVETVAGTGTYDEGSYPLKMDNIGTVEQTWTLTFDDATTFTVVGDELGAVGSGTTGADFSPQNPDFSKPYFTLEFAGFSGTFAKDDTIVFQTHPAAVPIWEKRDVPANCPSMSSNKIISITTGEAA